VKGTINPTRAFSCTSFASERWSMIVNDTHYISRNLQCEL
ncbi:unnamed protein product, partial [Larinioides sclopetarius]